MRIHVACRAAELDRLRPLWDYLFASSPSATLFQSYAWNRLAAAKFVKRVHPFVVAAESDSGAALIPAAIADNQLTLLGEELFDYRDVLSIGSEEAVHIAWLELAKLCLPLTVTALRGTDARERWSFFEPLPFVTAPQTLRSQTSPEQFGTAHSRLRRTLRRLAQQGAVFRRHYGNEADLVTWIYEQKAAQLAESRNNLFQDRARIEFMVAACSLDPSACEIFAFEVAGRPIATLLTLRDGACRRFYTVWFNSSWAPYSPGTALCFEVTRLSLAEGLDCDYMTGEQPHKTRFATSSVSLFRVEAPAELLNRVGAKESRLAA